MLGVQTWDKLNDDTSTGFAEIIDTCTNSPVAIALRNKGIMAGSSAVFMQNDDKVCDSDNEMEEILDAGEKMLWELHTTYTLIILR